MDTDIRELIGEDDLFFDPFEDETPEEEPVQVTDSMEEDVDIPLVGAPLEERPKVEDTRSPRERMDDLFGKMRSHKRLFLKLIDYCREPKTGEQMDARTAELTRYVYSVYSPVIIRELLEEAGAIDYLKPETEQPAETETGIETADASADAEEAPVAEESASSDGATSADAVERLAAITAAAIEDEPDDVLVPIDSGDGPLVAGAMPIQNVSRETFSLGDEEADVQFLDIEEADPGMWAATAEGLAYVDEQDDMASSRKLLAEEPRYLDIYHQILDYCSDPRGRSAKEVDNLINGSPLLEEPRRYSGYFVGRLEKQGSLEWRSGWYTTDVGMKLLEEARQEAAAAASEAVGA